MNTNTSQYGIKLGMVVAPNFGEVSGEVIGDRARELEAETLQIAGDEAGGTGGAAENSREAVEQPPTKSSPRGQQRVERQWYHEELVQVRSPLRYGSRLERLVYVWKVLDGVVVLGDGSRWTTAPGDPVGWQEGAGEDEAWHIAHIDSDEQIIQLADELLVRESGQSQ